MTGNGIQSITLFLYSSTVALHLFPILLRSIGRLASSSDDDVFSLLLVWCTVQVIALVIIAALVDAMSPSSIHVVQPGGSRRQGREGGSIDVWRASPVRWSRLSHSSIDVEAGSLA